MCEALHTVVREKSCAVLNFALFDSLVCIVARSQEKSRSLLLVPFLARYHSLSLSLTGLSRLAPTVASRITVSVKIQITMHSKEYDSNVHVVFYSLDG